MVGVGRNIWNTVLIGVFVFGKKRLVKFIKNGKN